MRQTEFQTMPQTHKGPRGKGIRTSRMAGTQAHASNLTMEHLARCFAFQLELSEGAVVRGGE
jgi:hypothetical protein